MTLRQFNAILDTPGKISSMTLEEVLENFAVYEGAFPGRHRATGKPSTMEVYIMKDRKPVIVVRCHGEPTLILEQAEE